MKFFLIVSPGARLCVHQCTNRDILPPVSPHRSDAESCFVVYLLHQSRMIV